MVEHFLHEVEIRCPAKSLPDRFLVRINELNLGESILARDIRLPDGAELLSDPDAVVAICQSPMAVEEVEEMAAPAEGAEPELIRRKEEETEESEG